MSKVIKCSDWSSANETMRVETKPACMTQQLQNEVVQIANALPDAYQQADVIVRTARADAQSVHDKAYSKGYEAGLANGMKTVDELINRLESDMAAITADRQAAIDSIEPQMLKLCIESVEKIIRHEVKTNPRVILRTIKSCLRRIKDTNDVHIRVNPSEVAEVRAKRDELRSISEGVPGINIIDDRRVSPGGCIIESTTGDFDARIETQVDQISKKLEETYGNGRHNAGS